MFEHYKEETGNRDLITLKEAASFLGVTPTTLRNWDRSGKLKAIRNPSNRYRMYHLKDLFAMQLQLINENDIVLEPRSPYSNEKNRKLNRTELRRLVRSLHRILRDTEGNSSLIERFDELSKILYCKVHDEVSLDNSEAFKVSITDSEGDIAHRVRLLFEKQVKEREELFPKRFSLLNLSDNSIAQIVGVLSSVDISHVRDDLKGLVYEEVIRNTFEKGDNQQFFTPRPIVEFIIQLIDGHLQGLVCDPACGTGGFLSYISSTNKNQISQGDLKILGFEIDERLAWVAGINLDMHRAANFEIKHLPGFGSLGSYVEPFFSKIDCIVTNPPFGSDLSDLNALQKFELGQEKTSRRRGALFIERCIDLLKPGGLLGIIIDESVLNGPINADARQLILSRADVFAVVSLPETAFMPYASVKSSILFLQKHGGKNKRKMHDGMTFFARANVVGRKPNGEPLFRINKLTGKQELDSDLPEIVNKWTEHADERANANNGAFWSNIPILEDKQFAADGYRLDLAYHHPSRKEAITALLDSPYEKYLLKDLCDIRNEAFIPSKQFQDEEVVYVGLANIEARTGVCSPAVTDGMTIKSTVKRFASGDILYSKMRPELRKACIISNDLDEGYASAECLVLVPKKKGQNKKSMILPELLVLLLRSDLVYGQIVHLVIGSGRPRISKNALMKVQIPVPPLEIQEELLSLYEKSHSKAISLENESKKALEQSYEIMGEARRNLVRDLLITRNK